ncbi:MAG TPA: hypothetical protein VFA57_01365 [Pseudolabrys sp.]|nr:hypothetical protein [Pseudolabrys sp.]
MKTNDPSLRLASNLLHLWALCGKPACRRARQCRRKPQSCARRYGPLVPEEALLGMLALLQGAHDGVDVETVRQYVPGDVAALERWTGLVRAAADGQASKTCE